MKTNQIREYVVVKIKDLDRNIFIEKNNELEYYKIIELFTNEDEKWAVNIDGKWMVEKGEIGDDSFVDEFFETILKECNGIDFVGGLSDCLTYHPWSEIEDDIKKEGYEDWYYDGCGELDRDYYGETD